MRVSVNMAMSMDGKIATKARGPMKLGTPLDLQRMSEIRALHDAVINGASTFRAYPYPLHVKNADLIKARVSRGENPQPISAVVSSQLERLPRKTPWELARSTERWIFCGRKASAAKILLLEKQEIKVVKTRGLRPSPREILPAFAAAGVKSVLLEGGGEFNASFLELGLVDKIHLTLTPLLIGGKDAPTWCEGKGFKKFPHFRLEECRQEKDEIYLTYTKS